ncbi:MAG TPA: hypothetical protein VFA68_02800 [Terriglobales bacterium]|nr:hypothetical protein [Terriglobales bacterium]
MKHKICFGFAMLVFVLIFGSLAVSQSDSLADYARVARKEKKATAKQYDNDNLPRQDKLSVVGNASPDTAQAADSGQAASAANNSEAQNPEGAKKSEANSDAEARQKQAEEWKKKIDAQKDQVALLSRELDVMQREYKLRAAAFYADAGNRLRNAGSWDKEDAQYKQQIADKQKALDQAKQGLDDLQEKARKAGVPAKSRE